LASFPGATEQISKIVKSLEAADAKEKRKLVKRKLEEEGEGAVKKSKKQSSSGKVRLFYLVDDGMYADLKP
jgi:hypothetical protein